MSSWVRSSLVKFMSLSVKNSIFVFSYDGLTVCFLLLKANSVPLEPGFKLTFSIRPRSLTGLLIHIGSQQGQHLSVYMEAGKVRSSLVTWERDMETRFHLWRP